MKRLLSAVFAALFLAAGCAERVCESADGAGGGTGTPTETDNPAVLQTVNTGSGSGVETDEPGVTASVLFLNVGKADCALILTGEKAFLIDTGTEASVPEILGRLREYGVRKLDGVFLTHTHSDHTGGFSAVASAIPVAAVFRSYISKNKKNGENSIDRLAEKAACGVAYLSLNDTVDAGGGCFFSVYGPLTENAEDDNDNSLVLMLNAGERRILFTGDMQFPEEETLLQAGLDLSADVLKVGNHGNPDATSETFAKAVGAFVAVITTDRETDEDSANGRVLRALGNAEIFITDETEAGVLVTIGTDGTVRTECPDRPETELLLEIGEINYQKQTVTVKNLGKASADLSGCMILTGRGGKLYVFPEGASLKPGEVCTVFPKNADGVYRWPDEKKPWSKKKEDSAFLFDSFGNLLDLVD